MFKRIISMFMVVYMVFTIIMLYVYAMERKQVGGAIDSRIEEQLKADLGIDKATKIL